MRMDFKQLQETTTAHIQELLSIFNPQRKETAQLEEDEGETFEVMEPDFDVQQSRVKEELEGYCKTLDVIASRML
jgi:hypothetical protein